RLAQRASKINELEESIDAHKNEVSAIQSEALELQKTIKALEVDLSKRDEETVGLQDELSSWKDKYGILEGTVSKRDTQIGKIESELAEFHTKIKDRDSTNASLVEEQSSSANQIADLQAKVQEQSDTIAQRDAKIHELEADSKADRRQLEALESELQAKTDTIQSRTSAIEAQHQTIKVLDQKNMEFQRQSDGMYESLRRNEKRVAELESMLATKDSALSTIQLGILKLSEFGAKPTSKRPNPKKQTKISVVYQEPPEEAEAKWCLINLDGKSKTRYPLHKSPITVGRGRANDIQIKNDFISGYHAEFVTQEDGVVLKDLGSTNSTRVNAKRVDELPLSHGDIITFGELRFEFVDSNQKPTNGRSKVARLK
ncbi:MAG: FHA domain-containing protein, partial [Pseudomonadota bacterium]